MFNTKIITSNYNVTTADDKDILFVDATAGSIIINLCYCVDISSISIKKVDNSVNTVSVRARGAERIENSASSYSLSAQLDAVILNSDYQSNWWVQAEEGTNNASDGGGGPHASTHLSGASDALAIGSPGYITDSSNSRGTSGSFSLSDHAHAHGDRSGGTLHAVAVSGGASGFMSGSDKAKIDSISDNKIAAMAGSSGTPSSSNTFVTNDDARNTNSRTPSAHAASHLPGGGDAISVVVSNGASGLMSGSDKAKLDGITDLEIGALLGTNGSPSVSNPFVTDSDPRNSNTRTPSSHASTHLSGGSDPLFPTTGSILELTDSTNTFGTPGKYSLSDHQHSHGNRGGGGLHSVAVANTSNGFLSSSDKAKIDFIQTSVLVTKCLNLRPHVASTNFDAGTNGNFAAAILRSGSAGSTDIAGRWCLPCFSDWSSDNIAVKIYWTPISSGAPGDAIVWQFSYAFRKVGDNLSSYSDVAYTENCSDASNDILRVATLGHIPSGSILTGSSNLFFFRLHRSGSSADTFDADAYVHRIEFSYTGSVFNNFPSQW